MDNSEEFDFYLNSDLSDFEGEWVAIKKKEIIFHDESERKVREEVKRSEIDNILISKVPKMDRTLAV